MTAAEPDWYYFLRGLSLEAGAAEAVPDSGFDMNESTTGAGEAGASMVEYALLVALIAIVALAAVRIFGTSVSGKFSYITSSMPE